MKRLLEAVNNGILKGLSDSDIVISLTGVDEQNIIISMYAYKQNVKKIVAKVNKESFVGILYNDFPADFS